MTTDYGTMGEHELVDIAQHGDDHAFSELARRHQANSLKLALSILHDKQDAEDEVQNAMWKAYEHLRQFQQDSKFSTWLTRIVVNQCLMRLRRARRAKFLYLEENRVGDDAITLELQDRRNTPERELGHSEVAEVLSREIHRIPPLLRNAFLLRDIQHLPMPDVAARLGISVAAAKSRLLRARLELRQRMAKHFGKLGPATLTV